jgi:CheY-like chemotaxis protein
MVPSKRVVLAVEDMLLVRMFISDVLTDEGFRVLEAGTAAEALTILQARPDVMAIVTDVEMPGGMNGYELAHVVKDQWPNIQIIISSGRAWPNAGDMPAGSIFLPKPVPTARLVDEVKKAVDRAEALLGGVTAADDPEAPNVVPIRQAE